MKTLDLIRWIAQRPEYTNIVIKGDGDHTPMQAINYLASIDQSHYDDFLWRIIREQNTLLVYLLK